MQATYNEAIGYIFQAEGSVYTNAPTDRGGPTKYGITIPDIPGATADTIRNLTEPQAAEIYVREYATPVGYNNLPAGVDYAVLDFGVNSGVSRALAYYHRVPAGDPKTVISNLCSMRLAFLRQIPGSQGWASNGKGWGNRVNSVLSRGTQMVDKYPAVTVPQKETPTPEAPGLIENLILFLEREFNFEGQKR